ncbi:hypothetical protein FXO37_19789 [Capsicum annuum]|nr:hypothetical protein FXO37_19789 [Capsicum annuum]
MDTSLIHVQSLYIEMMKNNFFFFRSSTNDTNKTPSPPLKSKEVSSWRSASLSSGSYYDSRSGRKNFTDLSKSPMVTVRKFMLRNLVVIQAENYQEKVKELKSETLLTTVLREKLYSKEIDIKQLQADQATTVRVHQNSTCGAAENVGIAAKHNGIMHGPIHTDSLAARRDALQSTIIRLREGFRRKNQNSSAISSEGCGSSVKCSSSADAGHLGNATVPCTGDGSTWNNIEGINSDKSIDSGRPSLTLRSSSYHLVVQEPEIRSLYVDKNLEHNSSLVVCSSSGLESQGGDSSTSTSANQQILDLNLALAFQEKLSDPRITSMLKQKGRHTDRELANLLQDKGLDPNFVVMLKENRLDLMILALLQRSSLDVDREHRDSNPPVTDSNDVEDVLPNHISFSEELRLQGLGMWLQRCRVMLHHVAGTPERA